ncbi:MAG: helix-turn-helix transcriptional regulator [Butyricicoccus sp.]|nr:helix-turn-helix transcriptional regulator [Butyricicoccus sp.]
MDAGKTGALIAQARKERELTQKDLAERLHVSAQAVSKWERGLSCPDIGLLEPLAEELGLTVTELLSGQRGEQPGEELMRDSLRFGLSQLGPKIRQWRWLFLLALALLLAVAAWLGWLWLRDNTELLPQRETEIRALEASEREQQIANALSYSVTGLHLYELTLADDLKECSIQAELWTDDGMEQTWELMLAGFDGIAPRDGMDTSLTGSGAGRWTPLSPRRQLLVLSIVPRFEWSETEQRYTEMSFECGLSLAGCSIRGELDGISSPYLSGGVAWSSLTGSRTVDREEGTVLLSMMIGGAGGGLHPPGALPPKYEGDVQLVVRLYCK